MPVVFFLDPIHELYAIQSRLVRDVPDQSALEQASSHLLSFLTLKVRVVVSEDKRSSSSPVNIEHHPLYIPAVDVPDNHPVDLNAILRTDGGEQIEGLPSLNLLRFHLDRLSGQVPGCTTDGVTGEQRGIAKDDV